MNSPHQIFPPLTAEEYAALKTDIVERGVLVPIVRDQHGNILDGHHRAAIAADLGIDCPDEVLEVASDDEARHLARVYNLARRHLTRKQKRSLIADEITADPDRSDREIGRLLVVDHKTVASVRRELGGEIPHPEDGDDDVPTDLEIAQMMFDVIKGRYDAAEDDEDQRQWALAIQVADVIRDWARGELPNLFWFVRAARAMYMNTVRLDVWQVIAIWLIPVAKVSLLECQDFRDRRGGDAKLPGEALARVTVALWDSDADDDMRLVMLRAMKDPIAMAVAAADTAYATKPASCSAVS